MVEVQGVRRPFMRGIMIHSLMGRGLGFEDAFETAEKVRAQLRERGVVTRTELAKLVEQLLGPEALLEPAAPTPVPVEIAVTDDAGRVAPFSKGVLAQSLLAASIDPSHAFEAAREIELELLRRDQHVVDRNGLRRLAYETLLRGFGERTAGRYLVWRHYEEPERPVIILLGGTTGAGKTSLGLEVARRLGIGRVLSTDSIRQVMRLMLSGELMPSIHASSFDAFRRMPPPADGDPEIEGFRSQASVVSVGVRAIIERAISENASVVLDGVALVPGLLDLSSFDDQADIIFLVVATLDEKAFAERFDRRSHRETRRARHRYLDGIEAILKIQDHFLELAEQHGVPIVDNVSVESSVQLIIRHVVETLRKRGGLEPGSLL